MEQFLSYFLPMGLCLIILFILFLTDIKAYIIHILTGVFAFIPILNWIMVIVMATILGAGICEGLFEYKVNGLTKFLFNVDDD